jgi:FlaA1/EpsC-like NDP-sugar epimerase
MPQTALIIGTPETCEQLERQLDQLPERPISLGWVLTEATQRPAGRPPVLGTLARLEAVVERSDADVALVCLPAAMSGLATSTRTRLRRLGIADRYVPPLEDLLNGVGPRTHIDIDLAALIARPSRAIDHAAIRGLVRGRRVLITGAGGSIGSELARTAGRHAPAQLVLVDQSENALFEIDRQVARRYPALRREALLHDVVDAPATLAHLCRLRPQIVFHAAAHKHVPMMEDHPAAAVDNNLHGTRSVADAASSAGADHVVIISTDKAVNPASIMGATKRLAELYVQWHSRRSTTRFSVVRFGNVLGSSGSVLDTWSRQIADGGPVTVTHPRMTRYFMTIPEAAALVMQAAALGGPAGSPPAAAVYLLDMGAPVRILDLAVRFIRQHGLEPRSAGFPPSSGGPAGLPIVFTGPRPGEKMHEELAYDAECMLPTAHPDINIWKLSTPDDQYVEEMLRLLSPGTRPADPVALARLIRRQVPEMTEPLAA